MASSAHPEGMAVFIQPSEPLDGVSSDFAWLEVMQKMDETYSELVAQQVALEAKNKELESTQAFLADVMGAMADVLIVCNADNVIEQVNGALLRATGADEQALVGRSLLDLFDEESRARLATLGEALKEHRRVEDWHLVLLGRDEPFPLSVNASRLADYRGRYSGAVLVGRPVGELKKAYADLEMTHERLKGTQQRMVHAEKMASLGRLVAGIAHEINNPLSFIYGNAHALKNYGQRLTSYLMMVQRHDSPELTELRSSTRIDAMLKDLPNLVDGLLEGAERTREIVESLRRYSSGQAHSREVVDLVPLIQTATRWVLKGQMPDMQLHYDMPPSLDIVAHSGNIQQVLMNLVQNAIDAMAGCETPRLDISVTSHDGSADIVFRDYGTGIPDGAFMKIFDPFYTTKPVGKGTGLGLSISYKIIAEHHGTFDARNHPEGGAVFSIRLPINGEAGHG